MGINTTTDDFGYRMKKIIKEFKERYNLDLSGEKLANKIWDSPKLAMEFGQKVLDSIDDYDPKIFDEK